MGRIDWFGWLRAGSPQENSPAINQSKDDWIDVLLFSRSSVINEISLALWALLCGGLWGRHAPMAPPKEEDSPKQSKRDWINEAENKLWNESINSTWAALSLWNWINEIDSMKQKRKRIELDWWMEPTPRGPMPRGKPSGQHQQQPPNAAELWALRLVGGWLAVRSEFALFFSLMKSNNATMELIEINSLYSSFHQSN